jgi:hypothetical protein
MQQATKTTVADSMSMMLGKYAQGVASQETLRQRGTEMLNKVVSKMKGKEALLIAGAAVAGAILMNPNQTPWFDKNAPGEGGEKYDRQVRWTAEPPVRVYKRDMHLKNKQADRMLSLLDAEKQNIIHSIQQKQSTLSDDRIRDAKGNLLSF